MLEKSGTIVLTDGDLHEFSLGRVSDRVKSNWGLSLQELKDVLDSKNYVHSPNQQ
jgi:hypothetical protein